MQITIITHPLRGNYGGMLQAYALKEVLTRQGHTVSLEAFSTATLPWFRRQIARLMKLQGILRLAIGLKAKQNHVGTAQLRVASRFAHAFVRHFRHSSADNAPDAYVVGSDQVWRCLYTRPMRSVEFFFLNETSKKLRARSIAYAASFGSEEWEGSEEETQLCASLLQDFKAVSVREHSGIVLCREHLRRADVVQMPDPTLLANTEDYLRIIREENIPEKTCSASYIAHYILDMSAEKRRFIEKTAAGMGHLPIRSLMANHTAPTRKERLPLSVGQWLNSLRQAKLLITDSFHGCVFAIIFNVPFLCIPNEERGKSRFETLLATFGLVQRMLHATTTASELDNILTTPIHWDKVNAIHESERRRGINFLREHLSCE